VKTRTCECLACHYCSMPLALRHEHDHFPVPRAAGGRAVVPACMNCHELKDRTLAGQWDATAVFRAVVELGLTSWDGATHATLDALDAEARWAQLSPAARLLYAKLRRIMYGSYPVAAPAAPVLPIEPEPISPPPEPAPPRRPLGRPSGISDDLARRILRERTAGASLGAIARALNADGVPTAQGGVRWYPSTVKNVTGRAEVKPSAA
jgi:hypothetical protein